MTTTAFDNLLNFDMNCARNLIAREGITISDTSTEDDFLIVLYAMWLYQKRNSNEPMPKMLRIALNNRLMAEKGGSNA